MNAPMNAAEIYDPFNYATHENPYPYYQKLRDDHPVYHNRKNDFWALSRYQDVVFAARNFKLFSSAKGTSLEYVGELAPILIDSDPAMHTRLRHLISGEFTPAHVARLEARVRTYAQRLLAPVRERGEFDVIADFSAKLPMAIICGLLGFPEQDEDMLRQWTDDCVHRDEGVFEMPEQGRIATMNMYGYFEEQMQSRRRNRREDIVQKFVDAEDAGQLSHEESLGYLYILSIAGNETTTKLIGNMAWQLDAHPAELKRLAANPALIAQAVEETMRIDGPTHMMARTTTADVPLHDKVIPAGAKVALLFMSANRDERKYPNADQFVLDRNPKDHLGFGGGIHACMGAALARLEARVAWEEIFKIAEDFEVQKDRTERMHSPQVRGFTHLPIRFTSRASAPAH